VFQLIELSLFPHVVLAATMRTTPELLTQP
jgi:hypothetical protein